jgi:hypothetical protein
MVLSIVLDGDAIKYIQNINILSILSIVLDFNIIQETVVVQHESVFDEYILNLRHTLDSIYILDLFK